jgi:hypothetical protein
VPENIDQSVGQQLEGARDKFAKVACFNCGSWGHFSTDCREPRLCFVC